MHIVIVFFSLENSANFLKNFGFGMAYYDNYDTLTQMTRTRAVCMYACFCETGLYGPDDLCGVLDGWAECDGVEYGQRPRFRSK